MTVKDAHGQKLLDEKLDPQSATVAPRSTRSRAGSGRTTPAAASSASATGWSTAARASADPTVVTREILAELKELTPLAPLHQPHNLAPIEAIFDRMPDVPQVAVFDTGFHRGHAPVATVVPLPRDLCKGGVERYGFHGISYEYIASVLPEVAPEIANGRVIVAHLGSGASLCAHARPQEHRHHDELHGHGRAVHGHAARALDPGIVLYLFQKLGLSVKQVEDVLYKKSGLLGISGISNDMRDLLGRSEPEARLAVDYFVYRAAKEIGALAAVLGGVDALVFTAGIGENSGRDPQADQRGLGVAGNRTRRGGERRQGPADFDAAEQGFRLGDPDERRTDDRPAHTELVGTMTKWAIGPYRGAP